MPPEDIYLYGAHVVEIIKGHERRIDQIEGSSIR